MRGAVVRMTAVGCLGAPALAQESLIGVDWGGRVYQVNTSTGRATALAEIAGVNLNAAAADSRGRVFAMSDPTAIVEIDATTGMEVSRRRLANLPFPSSTVRAMGFDSRDRLFVVLDRSGATLDDLAGIDLALERYTGSVRTELSDLQGLAFGPHDVLYGLSNRYDLVRLDPLTGETIRAYDRGIAPDSQALEFDSRWRAYCANANLRRLDTDTGASLIIGPTGADIRGLAFAGRGRGCLADCDTSGGPGTLDIFDFLCFQDRYAAGQSWACDCDEGTGPLVCDIFDFICFQNLFAAGCP